jgi:photosystem II stability/assembly factor-like uncharacterized protein
MNKQLLLKILTIFVIFVSSVYAQAEWERINSPTNKLLKHIFFADSSTGWCAGKDGIIFRTTDGGNNWSLQNSTVTTFIVDLFFLDISFGWALTLRNTPPFGTTILKTTNGGDEWIATNYPEDNVFMNAVFFFDTLNGWLGGSKIAGTTNGGMTWEDAIIDSNLVSNLPVLNFNFYNRQFGYACGGFVDLAGVIWRTTDYGANWSSTGVSPDEVFDMFVFDSLSAVTLSGDPEGAFPIGNIHTTDAGENWDFEELPLFGLAFAIDFRTENEGWSAAGPKFLFTSDKGINWMSKPIADSGVVYDLTFINPNTGYAVGENGLILKYIPQPTNVEDDSNSFPPNDFILFQNFPNPFNPSTIIKYEIPGQTRNDNVLIILKIYDVLGNEVATLVNEEKPAGTYEVEFNSHSGEVRNLSSGVYFYQLRTEGFIQSKKMILLR